MYQIGLIYNNGAEGVPRDRKAAFEWFTKSAQTGNSYGMYFLAPFYEYGEVVKTTYVELPPEVDTSAPLEIEQLDDGTWMVDGPWLQRLMANVNFGDWESRNWFEKKLKESGLYERLEEMGIEDGDTICLYNLEFEYAK